MVIQGVSIEGEFKPFAHCVYNKSNFSTGKFNFQSSPDFKTQNFTPSLCPKDLKDLRKKYLRKSRAQMFCTFTGMTTLPKRSKFITS